MAEESINLLATPDIVKNEGGNSRRNSMGKVREEKVVPHYLRASTGSCHDLCKYGRNRELTPKTRRPVRERRFTKVSDVENQEESLKSTRRKSTTTLMIRSSLDSETGARDGSDVKWELITKSPVDSSGVIDWDVATSSLINSSSASVLEAVTDSHVDSSSIIKPKEVANSPGGHVDTTKPEVMTKLPIGNSGIINREEVMKSHSGNVTPSIIKQEEKMNSSIGASGIMTTEEVIESHVETSEFINQEEVIKTTPFDTLSVNKQEEVRKSPIGSPGIVKQEKTTKSHVGTSTIKRKVVTKASVDTSNVVKHELANKSFLGTSEIIKHETSKTSPQRQISVKTKVLSEKKISVVNKKVLVKSCVETPDIIKREVSKKPSDAINSVERKEKKKTSAMKLKNSPISKSFSSDTTPRRRTLKFSWSSQMIEASKAHTGYLKKSRAEKPSPPSSGLSEHLTSRRNNSIKMRQITKTSDIAATEVRMTRKALSSPKLSFNKVVSLNARKYRSSEVIPSQKNQKSIGNRSKDKQTNDDTVQEKTFYVIKIGTDESHIGSDQNETQTVNSFQPSKTQGDESEFTGSEPEQDSFSRLDEVSSMAKVDRSGGLSKLRPRYIRVASPLNKNSESTKLHFKRGTIVDIQSGTNSPRRLKFRRDRLLVDSPNNKTSSRRTFKKNVTERNANDIQPNSEKVVLRHQDVQGKKDSQGLFNNVIEETASKLAETRKSKVKALVGAFETVISLQETKPSANIVP